MSGQTRYAPPEGFLLDPSSGLYYNTAMGTDPETGAPVQWVTWFDANSGEYTQVSYPMEQTAPEPQRTSLEKPLQEERQDTDSRHTNTDIRHTDADSRHTNADSRHTGADIGGKKPKIPKIPWLPIGVAALAVVLIAGGVFAAWKFGLFGTDIADRGAENGQPPVEDHTPYTEDSIDTLIESFYQSFICLEYVSRNAQHNNRTGGGGYGLARDFGELGQIRQTGIPYAADVYATNWTGQEYYFGHDWTLLAIFTNDANSRYYQGRYSVDSLTPDEAVTAYWEAFFYIQDWWGIEATDQFTGTGAIGANTGNEGQTWFDSNDILRAFSGSSDFTFVTEWSQRGDGFYFRLILCQVDGNRYLIFQRETPEGKIALESAAPSFQMPLIPPDPEPPIALNMELLGLLGQSNAALIAINGDAAVSYIFAGGSPVAVYYGYPVRYPLSFWLSADEEELHRTWYDRGDSSDSMNIWSDNFIVTEINLWEEALHYALISESPLTVDALRASFESVSDAVRIPPMVEGQELGFDFETWEVEVFHEGYRLVAVFYDMRGEVYALRMYLD